MKILKQRGKFEFKVAEQIQSEIKHKYNPFSRRNS